MARPAIVAIPLGKRDQIADARDAALHVRIKLERCTEYNDQLHDRFREGRDVIDGNEVLEDMYQDIAESMHHHQKMVQNIMDIKTTLDAVLQRGGEDLPLQDIDVFADADVGDMDISPITRAFMSANAARFDEHSSKADLSDIIGLLNAYQASDHVTFVVKRALFDTGANVTLHDTDIGNFYHNEHQLEMPVTGFDGGTSSRTSKQGDYHCYFMSFNPSYNGCSFKGTGNVIDDLPMDLFSVIASMRHENIAYRVDLGTIPADDTERQADFCGCYRLDAVTGQRINIPARYDATRHCWFTHAVYASSAAEAKRIGVIIERRLQQDSQENVGRFLASTLPNQTTAILEFIRATGQSAKYICGLDSISVDGRGQIEGECPFFTCTPVTMGAEEDLLRFQATRADLMEPGQTAASIMEKLDRYEGDGLTCHDIEKARSNCDSVVSFCDCCDFTEQMLRSLNEYHLDDNDEEMPDLVSNGDADTDSNSEEEVDERPELQTWFDGNPFAALRETDDMMAKPVQADPKIASDDSSSKTDYDTTEPVTAGVKSTMHHSKDRKMTALQFHESKAHMGSHPDCLLCKSIQKSMRKIHPAVDPYRDNRAGATFSGDIIYWNVESRHGNKYSAVFRDDASDVIKHFNMATRKDTSKKMEHMIETMRNDPAYHWIEKEAWKLFSHCRLDLAGEWDNVCRGFNDMRERLGFTVDYAQPGYEGNHRSASRGENLGKQVELRCKAIMVACSLSADWWEEALAAAITVMNLFPTSRRVTSRDGDAPRPDEILSNGQTSRRYCNHVIHYYENPGTPAMVSTPEVRGSNLLNPTRCREAIRLGMIGTLPLWQCPHTGVHFRSKDYLVLNLPPGQNAWQMFKCANVPTVPVYFHAPPQNSEQISAIIIDESWTIAQELPSGTGSAGDDAVASAPAPAAPTESLAAEPCPETATDAPVVHETSPLLQTTDQKALKKLGLVTAPPSTTREKTVARLTDDADSFINHEVFKYFADEGVLKGIVVMTDTAKQDGSVFWRIIFDCADKTLEYSEDFSQSEMVDFHIDRINGTTAAPILPLDYVIPPLVPTSKLLNYMTDPGDTYPDVCAKMHIPRDQWRLYYQWLTQHQCYGHPHRHTDRGLHFNNPWGGTGHKSILKPTAKQTVLPSESPFPFPKGDSWDSMLFAHVQSTADLAGLAARLTNMEFCVLAEYEKFRAKLEHQQDDQQRLLQRIALTLDMEDADSEQGIQFDIVCAALDATSSESAYIVIDNDSDVASAANQETVDWPEAIDNAYVDKVTGKIVAPKNMIEAQQRSDWSMWERAFKKEQDGLDKLGVYQHNLSLNDLRAMGYTHKPVTQLVLFMAKYSPTGIFEKAKCRIVVRGHKHAMKQGVHYHATFAASPKDGSVRLLQALVCHPTLKMHRLAWDIVQAFPQAALKPEEMIILSYPKGQERRAPDGTIWFCLLIMNLYGSPAANRYFCLMRDKWILNHFNGNLSLPGWSVKQCRYDACMFYFISPTSKRVYAVIHTDDIDCVCESLDDGMAVMNSFDEKFGVVICDPDYMLGIKRTVTTDADGFVQIELTQPDFIESMVQNFEPSLPKKASAPTPTNLFLSSTGNAKGELPSDKEVEDVMSKGYQSGVGSLLWAARRCHPVCSFGVSQMCRLMARPSYEALDAMLHMIKYLSSRSNQGIRYSSRFSGEPYCHYDASNKNDPKDSKAQYGWIVFMFGGPILWASKKHKHVGVQGSMQNEYMASGHACRQVAWLRFLLHEMDLDDLIPTPTAVLGDNDPCTRLIWNDIITEGNQFFWREYHFAKECYERGLICPLRIDTTENKADTLTKAKPGIEIEREDDRLRGYSDEHVVMPEQPIGQHRVSAEFDEMSDPSCVNINEFNFDDLRIHAAMFPGHVNGPMSITRDGMTDFVDICPGLFQQETSAPDSAVSGGEL